MAYRLGKLGNDRMKEQIQTSTFQGEVVKDKLRTTSALLLDCILYLLHFEGHCQRKGDSISIKKILLYSVRVSRSNCTKTLEMELRIDDY